MAAIGTESRDAVEITHSKILEKFDLTKKVVARTWDLVKNHEHNGILSTLLFLKQVPNIDSMCDEYIFKITPALAEMDAANMTTEFYETISRDGYAAKLDHIAKVCCTVASEVEQLIAPELIPTSKYVSAKKTSSPVADCSTIFKTSNQLGAIQVASSLERVNYDICTCGNAMTTIPELSELICSNPECGSIHTMVGVIFRDDQNTQDGVRPRQNKDDTFRHYKNTMNYLQDRCNKQFPEADLKKIEYVIKRDRYVRSELNCDRMRTILADPMVKLTEYNDFVPALIKRMGGKAPPMLTHAQDSLLASMFCVAMDLHAQVVPVGNNKPHYPFFIAHLIRQFFGDNPEIMRLNNYIHRQSRETIIRCDLIYEDICALSTKPNKLEYVPTDLSGR